MTAVSTSPKMSSFNNDLRSTIVTTSPQLSPRLNSPGPLPLPDFQFPARGPSMSSSAPSSFSRATGRRPVSAVELSRPVETESLPQFSFGSPTSTSPRTIPPRPSSMHQRNVSEFIGGDGKTGNGEILSTSPTKSESALPLPQAALGPPPGRRGHAHRRSAAISVSDLSMILKPNAVVTRGSSAPNSPSANSEYQNTPFPHTVESVIQTASDEGAETVPVSRTPKNTRVGFSDDVEFIPRPLSMVSSDSASTVRPGHSVSNSMSSIMSAAASSPPSKEKRGFLSNQRISDARPRTAEPILDQEKPRSPEPTPRRRSSLPLLSDVATASTSAPSTPRSAKKWSFFGHDHASGESSPKSRPTSAASSAKESKKVETAPSSPEIISDVPFPTIEPTCSRRSSMSRKPSKKQKRVKTWAGSILSRKSRQRKQKLSRRSPTPPLRYTSPIDEVPTFEFVKSEYTGPPPKPELQTDFASWKPRKVAAQEESMSPIIDLDAALGPFNTPSSFGNDWDMSQKGGARRKKAMHSAAGLGGFTGPGMHYHRRAESAPEFENPRFGLHRLGSNSTMGMEDVFEEDEDEEWEDSKASDKEPSIKVGENDDEEEAGLGIGIKVVDSDGMESEKCIDFENHLGVKHKGSNLSEGRPVSPGKSLHSTTSLVDEPIEEESGSPVEIADDSIPPRPDSGAQSSDSTATPPFRANAAKGLAPVDVQPFSLQPPYHSPTSPRSIPSSFPSPRSPFSYDAQRISTAPSSITDENVFRSLMGEPGPEVRMSVDDVPSLTSSNSTMTRESGHPGFGNPQFRDGQRSASLSSAAVTRKRSSMASLSRLISSSHGERSKLSIENRAPTPDGEKKEKTSKGKRISRMMQFWKTKDTS